MGKKTVSKKYSMNQIGGDSSQGGERSHPNSANSYRREVSRLIKK